MSPAGLLLMTIAIVIVCVIAITVIPDLIRKKDFSDQVSGKKPCRRFRKGRENYDAKVQENSQITIDRELLKNRSVQNLLGPKN